MKKIAILAGILSCAALSGCHNADDLKMIEDQARANDSLVAVLNEKAQALTEISDAVASFQTRLVEIKEKHNIVSMRTSNPEVSRSQLLNDIDVIAEEMEKNKKTIQSLRYSQSQSKTHTEEYQKVIDALQLQIDQQAEEIAALNEELAKRNIRIAKLEDVVAVTTEELDKTKIDLSETAAARATAERTVKEQKTVRYVIDTEDNLISAGIIDDDDKVVAQGTESVFTTMDRTTQFSISLPKHGRKFKVLTKQSDNRRFRKSYTIDTDSKTLHINNPGIFWGADKYLVIMITKLE